GVRQAAGTLRSAATAEGRAALRALPEGELARQAANVADIGVGAGMEVGTEAYQQYQEGEFDPVRLGIAAAGGSLLNEPNRIGRRLGLSPNAREPGESTSTSCCRG